MNSHLQVIPSKQRSNAEVRVLDIEHLCKNFCVDGNDTKDILQDISFTAKRGELICILGRSGCGKSTLLKLLAGFLIPSSGSIKLSGQRVTRPGPDRCIVFQEDALFPWLTVRENIAFGLNERKLKRVDKQQEVDRFLALVGLTDFANYLPVEISGGMKQRVSLARVLILQPDILLMDEPFAALDAQTREEMQNLLLMLWKKLSHTILFVTHDVNEAVLLADRILLFNSDPGQIKEDISIALPRPRDKVGADFLKYCRSIRTKI